MNMITFTILLAIIIALVIIGVITVLIGGGALVFTFADVIVCGILIYFIIRLFKRH